MFDARILVGRTHQRSVGVVAEARAAGAVGESLLDDVAEGVAHEGDRLRNTVDTLKQPSGRIVGVGHSAAVEVLFGDEIPCGVVIVGPARAGRVFHRSEPQLSVVPELEAGAVCVRSRRDCAEGAVFESRLKAGPVGVRGQVAARVISP
jgi:hypothetical protein